MKFERKVLGVIGLGSCVALASMGSAAGQPAAGTSGTAAGAGVSSSSGAYGATSDAKDEARAAAHVVDRAAAVIQRMRSDPRASELLHDAKGVFVATKFGRAAVGIGGAGGEGLLLVKRNGEWTDPAFYNFGDVSVGAQIGAEGGSFVLVLNNDQAVQSFTRNNDWSLDADAGLTIVNWSKEREASAGKGDVTLWSDAKGLFAGAALGVADIKFDPDQTSAYYGRNVVVGDVVSGKVNKAQAAELTRALGA